jgi:hypothetical protein
VANEEVRNKIRQLIPSFCEFVSSC